MIFIEEAPPETGRTIAAYLRRMFVRIDSALNKDVIVRQWDKFPPSPTKYTLVAFTVAIPNTTVTTPGIYYYDGTNWQKL